MRSVGDNAIAGCAWPEATLRRFFACCYQSSVPPWDCPKQHVRSGIWRTRTYLELLYKLSLLWDNNGVRNREKTAWLIRCKSPRWTRHQGCSITTRVALALRPV